MSFSHTAFSYFVSSLAAYVALAIGGFSLTSPSIVALLAMALAFLFAAFMVLNSPVCIPREEILLFLAFAAVLIFGAIRTDNPHYAIPKIDGVLLAGSVLILLSWGRVKTSDYRFIRSFVCVALLILVLTAAYKLHYGFFARDVRFFLNGPIVFGWLMGVSALLSFHLAARVRSRYWFLVVVFFLALIWSGSKGPLIAFVLAFGLLSLYELSFRRWISLFVSFIVVLALLHFLDLLPARFYSLFRIATGPIGDSDWGSIGVRIAMWLESGRIFLDSPFIGTGVGNWPSALDVAAGIPDHLHYPHNFLAEVLSEQGLLGLLSLLGLCVYLYIKTSVLGKAIFLFAGTALLFSGDAAYWQFLIALPALFIVRARKNRGTNCSHWS